MNPFGAAPRQTINITQPYYQGAPLFVPYDPHNSSTSSAGDAQQYDHTNSPTACTASTSTRGAMFVATEVPSSQRELFPVYRNSKKVKKAKKLCDLQPFGLKPRCAVQALASMCGPMMPRFTFCCNGIETMAELVLNGTRYTQVAANKKLAKNKVAEQVLYEVCRLHLADNTQPGGATSSSRQDEEELSESDDGSSARTADPDSTEVHIMKHIASFALFELFTKWKLNVPGFNFPARAEAAAAAAAATNPDVVMYRSELPAHANTLHPTVLLGYMVPKVEFLDAGRSVVDGKTMLMARVKVGEHEFIGTGTSKRIARKAAAQEACNVLFGVDYN